MYFYDEDDGLDRFNENAEEALEGEQNAEDEEQSGQEQGENVNPTGDPIQDAINKINSRENPSQSGEEKNPDGTSTDNSSQDNPTDPGISGEGQEGLAEKAADAAQAAENAEKVDDVVDAATGGENPATQSNEANGQHDEKGEGKGNDQNTNNEKTSPEASKPQGEGTNPNGLDGGAAGGQLPQGQGGAGLDKAGIVGKAAQGLSDDGLKGGIKEAGKEAVKQVAKEKAKQMGLDVMLKSITSALAPVLFWLAIIVIIFIIAVGLLMFFIAMPGQIVAQVRTLALSVVKAWTEMVKGGDQMVTTAQLANAANYIEKMGYDLKGEGFVSADKISDDIPETINSLTNIFNKGYDESSDMKDMSSDELHALLYLDEKQGVIRRNDTNEVVDLNSDPLFSYIVSDNQCFIIRNFNTNLDEMTGGHGNVISNIILGIAAVIGTIVMLFTPVGWITALVLGIVAAAGVAGTSYLAVKLNNNPNYGTGLITIYHEGDDIGITGDYYEEIEKGYIALDVGSKQLKIKRGWANGIYSFDVDGWSGRYGMPLEFLLSVHLATQMPDLAIEMATSFETEVEVLLHPVTGSMTAGVLKEGHSPNDDGDFITYATVSEIGKHERDLLSSVWEGIKDFGNFITGVFTGDKVWTDEELEELCFNDRAINTLYEQGLPHALGCTCCSHISGNRGNNSDESCTDDTEVFDGDGDITNNHVLCDACKDRMWKLIGAIKICNDKEWESYTPYISKVTDHWFRDVYFVMNEDENEFTDVVQVDEDYFYETGERWTMYETWEEGESRPEGFEVGDYKLYEEGSNTPSNKTKKEVQEINDKIAKGDTSVTRLVKKAITQSLEPNAENGKDWSAYELTDYDNTLPWQKMNVTQDSAGELTEDAVYEDEDSSTPDDILIYYKESRPADIKQVEDGQRAQTNPEIKKMFLDKKYYKYDGSVDRADAIMEDRENSDPSNYNTSSDSRNEDLIAKVDINKDSLSAFSILENTHTLDADYIYRDFKELIVELNYFDKEDLSDKIQEVMQWLIPETGVSGWPIRRYEKGEDFYGTLINSKKDLSMLKKQAISDAEGELEELEDEVEGAEVSSNTKPKVKGSVAEFVNKGYEIHSEMEGNGWDYCVLNPDEGCDHQYGHGCGLNTSIQDAVSGHHNACCATYVSWVLNEMGYGFVSHAAKATYDWCAQNGFTPITDYSSMQPGDLLFNKSGYSGNDVSMIGHVQLLGNNGEWLNAGSVDAINDPPRVYDPNFIIGMRPNLNGAAAEFEGYEPDQVVVAPISGKVIEKGTVPRTNVETGQLESVGFIKIQAIDHYVTGDKGKKVYQECTTEDTEYDPENTYDPDKKEGWDYFYEEYRGVVDSCVMYIEGFDLTIDETIANSDFSSSDVTMYEPNEVYNMTDNLKEAQALWKEDAKSAAVPYFWDGSDLYIKEGTVIGKTMEDTTAITEVTDDFEGNGNYIRLILRDLEDSIMEDVESYFDIPPSYSFNGSALTLQNCESMNQELASLIEQLAGPLESQYPGIVNILKAISMNESGGGNNPAAGDDPMQAVESTGGNAGDSIGGMENSVTAAINALTSAWDKAKSKGINDLRVVIQAYNFGSGFVDYVANNGGTYSKTLVSNFSDEQAASHGWSRYGDKDYVDPKIYKYLPDLDV